MYDKVKEYILLIARTELLTCAACQSSFSTVQDHANMVCLYIVYCKHSLIKLSTVFICYYAY